MKALFRLSILLMFMSFYSCDKEEITDNNTIENYNAINLGKIVEMNEAETLENTKEWVIYIAGQVLVRNASARQSFIEILANSPQSNLITLESLLGGHNAFKEAFQSEFSYYANGSTCQYEGKKTEPDGFPRPSDKAGSFAPDHELYPTLYVNSLLDDYDFAFYLPNGYKYSNQKKHNIKSSVHVSGSSEKSREGYHHFDRCDVNDVTIKPNSRGTILILKTY